MGGGGQAATVVLQELSPDEDEALVRAASKHLYSHAACPATACCQLLGSAPSRVCVSVCVCVCDVSVCQGALSAVLAKINDVLNVRACVRACVRVCPPTLVHMRH